MRGGKNVQSNRLEEKVWALGLAQRQGESEEEILGNCTYLSLPASGQQRTRKIKEYVSKS